MSEIAVVSARKVRLQQRAKDGSRGAQTALELANDPNRFLSAVQIGITLIGILAGAFGGATIAEELEAYFSSLPFEWLNNNSEAISVGLVVLAITYLSLVLGELTPKRIGLNDPEGIASKLAPIMQMLTRLTSPLVNLLSSSSNQVLRLLGIKPSAEAGFTEEEIKLLIEHGTESGIFEPEEGEMVEQVFRLADRPITTQMTPRTEVVWLDLNDPVEDILATLKETRFTYYPVARDNMDKLVGVVDAKDLLAQCVEQKNLNLEQKIIQPLFFPKSMTILDALRQFRESHYHVAFIIDEYGGIHGMATITDILEAIAGDFPDALDMSDLEIVAREDGSFLLDGLLHIDELKELFQLDMLPGEGENQYQTLGGFMMTFMGRVPKAGDYFEWQNVRLEVVDMDGLRIDKVLASPVLRE